MDAGIRMIATCLPSQPGPHPGEDVVHRPDWQYAAGARYEERSFCAEVSMAVTYLPVLVQRVHDARVQR